MRAAYETCCLILSPAQYFRLSAEADKLIAQPLDGCAEVRKPPALLFDDRWRCLGNERLVAQLAVDFRDLAFDAGKFLANACLFRRPVDFHVQAETGAADHCDRRSLGGGGPGGL